MSFAKEINPLNKRTPKVFRKCMEKKKKRKFSPKNRVIPRLIEVYMGITNNYGLNWVTMDECTKLK